MLTAEGPQLTFSPTMKIIITILMGKTLIFIYLRFCKQMSDDIARLKAAPACYRACKATVNTLPPLPGNL